MSMMQQMIKKAEQMEAAEQAALDAERAEAQRICAAEIAERRAKLVEWLGPLANEMAVSEGEQDSQARNTLHFRLTPHAWRLSDVYIKVTGDTNSLPYYSLDTVVNGRLHHRAALTDAAGKWMADYLMIAQRLHDAALTELVQKWAGRLAVARDAGCSDDAGQLDAALATLLDLAPERAAEWDAIHAGSMAELTAEAAAQEARLTEWRRRLVAYRDERDAVMQSNTAALQRLQGDVDVPLAVRELEYAVVDGRTYSMHVDAWATWVTNYDPTTGRGVAYEHGRAKAWTFDHVVRVGDEQRWSPTSPDAPRRALFLRRETPYGEVVFAESFERMVDAEIESWPALPQEPEWSGEEWGMTGAARAIYHEVLGARPVVEGVPF